MRGAAVGLALLLSACATAPPPRVQTVPVHVPVPVQRAVPAGLLACGAELPLPVFVPAVSASGAALVGLDRVEADKLLQLIAGLDGCNRAWSAWANADSTGD